MTALEDYARGLASAPAPDEARLTLHLMDSLGACIAGTRSAAGREIAAAAAMPGFGSSALDRVATAVAMTRLTEIDDIHMRSCTTCGSIIVPAAVIMAGELNSEAAQLFAAIRDGYETMMRFGVAIDGPTILYRGLWPSYLAAPLGVAAATAALLGLDVLRTANALSLALAQTSGAVGTHASGLSPRWILCGLAARAGILSALMAARGYAADRSLLDDDWLLRTHGIACDVSCFVSNIPVLHETSIKPWCAAKQTVAAITAFRSLLSDGLSIQRIAAIRVETPNAYRAMIASRPPGRLGKILNIGWQFGIAAIRPDLALDVDRQPTDDDARIEAVAMLVEVNADDALDALFPNQWPARVVVTLDDGSRHERLVTDAPGDSIHQFDCDQVIRKVLAATSDPGKTHVQRILELAARPLVSFDVCTLNAALTDESLS